MNTITTRESITTVGMASGHKGIKDRVVMRKSVSWFEDGKYNKKNFVLRSSTVKILSNKNLNNSFIKSHNLSEEDIYNYEKQFDLTRSSWEKIAAKSSTETIDLQNRLRSFLSKYFYALNPHSRYPLSLKNCKNLYSADIRAKTASSGDDYRCGFHKLIDTVNKEELVKLIEESKAVTSILERYLGCDDIDG